MNTVPELFQAAVSRWPDAPAVIFQEHTVTYSELNSRVNRFARRLVAAGVGPDDLVAVAAPRSIELVVAVLAVLTAGGAYLPLEPNYPEERLAYMISDARPVLLVRSAKVRIPGCLPEMVIGDPGSEVPGGRDSADNVDALERRATLLPSHLMYVIYTSGSTGRPKGVAVTHGGVADLVETQTRRIGVKPGERVLQWASISFDAAFWELSLALFSGATLVLASSEELLPGPPLRTTLSEYDIAHAVLPPVALSVTDEDGLLTGGTVMSTGDSCTSGLVRKWSAGRRMFNGYGPTEVTIGASVSDPIADPEDASCIGTPWEGHRVYVLDERLREVPAGTEGEFYIAGSGLARCYLDRPGLSAARFVAEPFGRPGERMYRSGDRGRRRADGELFFTGRTDDQVKVRGFRLELGEIEACLASHPAVEIAVAVIRGRLADARVAAYVTTAAGTAVSHAELRRYVARFLPAHMVPAHIVSLDRFPMTPNGKIDRDALRDRAGEAAATARPTAAKHGVPYEQSVCEMVAEILEIPRARSDDNFFDIGGHSVLAVTLVSRIRKELDVRIPVRAVFEAGTLAELSKIVENSATKVASTDRFH